jgi:membrane-bound lytic murein transglycosylase D
MIYVSARQCKWYIALLYFSFFSLSGFSKESNSSRRLVSGCKIVESLEQLSLLKVFPDSVNSKAATNTSNYPTFPDLAYEYRIAEIDNLSPIDFDFNSHVKRYIEIYTIERRDQVSQMLGLAELYFPLFEEYLDKYNLPLELKYLAVVESALNPLAVSPSGAVGLWQFKLDASRMFDLEVNSYIDERMDPVKATEAACVYLEYLYRIFNNWHLALAAYNAGPGAVRNAIQRSGGETNFWKIFDALPVAAQNYVPAFIAAGYVMKNAESHGIRKVSPLVTFALTDTVMIKQPANFSVIASKIGVSVETIQFLNPMYRQGFIPKSGLPVPIHLPKKSIPLFIANEVEIYESLPQTKSYSDITALSGSTKNKVKFQHTILAGEYLHKIAIKYGCTIDDLQVWNPQLANELAIGQIITVWADSKLLKRIQNQQ